MGSFLDRWLDGVEDGWAIPLLLAIFVALWTLFLMLAYQNAGLHPDVLEVWILGRMPEWGSLKHPPLMGWISYLWTSVFPARDWSFHLLAMTNAAVALWVIDLTTRRFASGDKRIIVLLLLMLLPIYQFQAQRFNANSVLFAVWPLAIYCFMKSFETRQAGWAAAAGIVAALAILGKYYSAFLIAGFAFAAICHPARCSYFTSWTPWISGMAGVLLLAPHVYWLSKNGVGPFDYALAAHGGITAGRSLMSSVNFLLGLIATLATALAFYSPDHPAFVIPYNTKYEWQMPSDAQLRAGWATTCLPDEETCLVWSKQIAAATPGAISINFMAQPRWWGRDGIPSSIFAVLIPPRAVK